MSKYLAFRTYRLKPGPDGTRIAFATNRDGDFEIYVMDADGSNPINLSRDPRDDSAPAWGVR